MYNFAKILNFKININFEFTKKYFSGHLISCFVIGGECRLCFPQIYSLILKDIEHETIVTLFKELRIQTRQATPEQMESLKLAKALPMNATSCGLMTKSDAERLVALLKQREEVSLSAEQRRHLESVVVRIRIKEKNRKLNIRYENEPVDTKGLTFVYA